MGKVLTHITREHDKPNIFEGTATPHPKASSCYANGESSGSDAKMK